jgi:hypothetical protein
VQALSSRSAPEGLHARILVAAGQVAASAFVVLGILGLLRTGLGHLTDTEGERLVFLELNGLTSIVHLVAGLVGAAMTASLAGARRYALAVGVLGTPFALLGYVLDATGSDIFGRNATLTTIHLVVALAALVLALWPSRPRHPASSRDGTAEAA